MKTGFADYLVQTYVERVEKFDFKRNMTFTLFGLFYLGAWQYFLYCKVFPYMFRDAVTFATASIRNKIRDRNGQMAALSQLIMDQFCHHPFMYFPFFYFLQSNLNGGSLYDAYLNYKNNVIEDCQSLWKLWVPVMAFNFTFAPIWARIPIVATASLIWTMIISYNRGSWEDPNEDKSSKSGATHHTTREAGLALMGHFNHRPALNPDRANFVVTMGGGDETGLLSRISECISSVGGVIEESKLIVYGDAGAVVMLVSTEKENSANLRFGLEKLHRIGTMNAMVMEASGHTTDVHDSRAHYLMTFVGPECSGIVQRMSTILSHHGFNIDSMNSGAERGRAKDGSPALIASLAVVCSAKDTNELRMNQVFNECQAMCDDMDLSFELRRLDHSELFKVEQW